MKKYRHKRTGEVVMLSRLRNFYLVYEYVEWKKEWVGAYFVSPYSLPDWLEKFEEIGGDYHAK
jgi:hypothetical protein